jgi:alpha-beta hydrolase superfamily lysophospholipase
MKPGLQGYLIAGVLLVLAASGCARQYAPPGPGPTPPALALDQERPPPEGVTPRPVTTGSPSPVRELRGDFTTEDGLALPLRAWLPQGSCRAVILALHGFNDYSNAFSAPGRAWASQGIAVYAYDQRGFGEAPHTGLWPGAEVLADDVATAAALLRRRYPGKPLFLLGESMGAAVLVVAETLPEPPDADGLILSAPAVWASWTQPWYQRAGLWVALRLFPGFKPEPRGLGIQASDNIEMLRELGRDPLVIKRSRIDTVAGLVDLMSQALEAAPRVRRPTLVLYGEKDEVVPADPVRDFWREMPKSNARLALYDNGWHLLLRDLDAERVIGDTATWMADPKAPLPSRAEAQGDAFEATEE